MVCFHPLCIVGLLVPSSLVLSRGDTNLLPSSSSPPARSTSSSTTRTFLTSHSSLGEHALWTYLRHDAVKTGRVLLGATNPLASAPGTIRGDYAIDVGRNVCHGSDSVENAQKEIDLWFSKEDLVTYKQSQHSWIYEK
ncbi:unnamed protein product [Tuber melanosporum]|uniref:Nucleoside diphosphate kinase n=1 Tax=Tuber melanosporum (strain Mel28) TaxID=656061 RepID=D5G3Z0_TUBMM|nr:uncharacterized protein GSTUM_00003865001 [Tuber melanosporum]CAZ79233.1 unnamed protein product [Tuber melanosporum]